MKPIWQLTIAGLLWLVVNPASAELLGGDESADAILTQLAPALSAHNIDVLPNLNDRRLARNRSFPPRLGRFPDLPNHRLPLSDEIETWETGFAAGEIAGIAIIENPAANAPSGFWQQWADTWSDGRIIVSFARENLAQARSIAEVAGTFGHATLLLDDRAAVAEAARFYATAARRFALDSPEARRLDGSATEFAYLGERVRRNSNSIFREDGGERRLAREEPPRFRKESLGDEFSESTVREIIVPGGVALGETASVAIPLAALRYEDQQLKILDQDRVTWHLPDIAAGDAKALFDFAERSHRLRSDSIVDIDGEGRVKLSTALRDTDVGYRLMHADTLPFEYVPYLQVTKSVIIDTWVNWTPAEAEVNRTVQNALEFVTDFEVRFLNADNMRLAQTRVAIEYVHESATGQSVYRDKWGRDKDKLRENMDYAGLGNEMVPVANAAAWLGLMRLVLEQDIPFIEGRYEFMKLSKAGRETPARY